MITSFSLFSFSTFITCCLISFSLVSYLLHHTQHLILIILLTFYLCYHYFRLSVVVALEEVVFTAIFTTFTALAFRASSYL
jgi:hypothetical protein